MHVNEFNTIRPVYEKNTFSIIHLKNIIIGIIHFSTGSAISFRILYSGFCSEEKITLTRNHYLDGQARHEISN